MAVRPPRQRKSGLSPENRDLIGGAMSLDWTGQSFPSVMSLIPVGPVLAGMDPSLVAGHLASFLWVVGDLLSVGVGGVVV